MNRLVTAPPRARWTLSPSGERRLIVELHASTLRDAHLAEAWRDDEASDDADDAEAARIVAITLPGAHRAPLHIGDPAVIGIADVNRPDVGEPTEIRDGELRCSAAAV